MSQKGPLKEPWEEAATALRLEDKRKGAELQEPIRLDQKYYAIGGRGNHWPQLIPLRGYEETASECPESDHRIALKKCC
jgi:hypothetical protein